MNFYPTIPIPYQQIRTAAALIAGGFFAVGTGGHTSGISAERILNPTSQRSHPFASIQHATQIAVVAGETTSALEPLEDLKHIMTVLNPNISELAKVLHVSRQAIYKWINGEGISQESAEKLQRLARAADVFAEADLTVTLFMLRRTVTKSQSFLEIVESGGSAVEAARALVQIVQIGQRQRTLLNERLANKESNSEPFEADFPVSYLDDY